jgi:hypothetical protein
MNRKEALGLALAVAVLAFLLNRQFLDWVSLPRILAMNDVPAILAGVAKVPNLLFDSGSWWTGTWVQQGISAYRPLASYLYWLESRIGLQWGFVWVGWLGVLLLTANALASGILAWRLTQSKSCVWLAAVLSVALRFFNWAGTTPDYWLAWYPVHQELLMNLWLMAAIISFDVWNETAKHGYLAGAWVWFLLGIFTKEHVYIFPAFALAIVQFRRRYGETPAKISWRTGMVQVVLMFTVVFALWAYRASILIDPRNPHLRRIHFLRKPWLYIFYPFYRHILTGQFWFPGLAALLFAWGGVLLRWRATVAGQIFLRRAFAGTILTVVSVALVVAYCSITFSVEEAFWYLCEPALKGWHLLELPVMIFTFYTIWLLLKYRKQQPTALAFTFLVLAYVPVLTYLGWHYTVASWFVRSAYWALVAKLVWIDLAPLLTPLTARFFCSYAGGFGLKALLQTR